MNISGYTPTKYRHEDISMLIEEGLKKTELAIKDEVLEILREAPSMVSEEDLATMAWALEQDVFSAAEATASFIQYVQLCHLTVRANEIIARSSGARTIPTQLN